MRGEIEAVVWKRSLGGVAGLGLLCALAREARADANDVKGTIGGAMLGAEVVMLTEGAFRLRPRWMYLAGGAGGALAGGYLGYRISDDSSNRPPSFLLAGGIALIIPTIMGVLTATQYEPGGSFRHELPEDDADEDGADEGDADEGDADEDASEPEGDDFAEPDPADSNDLAPDEDPGARAPAPRLELPTFRLAQAFSRDEVALHGVRQTTELHLALLRGVF